MKMKIMRRKTKTRMNRKYELLDKSLKALSESAINLLILKGNPGTGKTFTTLKYVKDNSLNYKYVNNYATPLAFYKLIYENREKDIIIFDDVQSICDPKIKSMLKSVCGELDNGKRIISYYTTSPILEQNDLPDSFELDVNVVLIFNDSISGFEPITNRGITIDFFFNFKEMIKVLEEFQEQANIDEEVMDYVRQNCNQATSNLSIRTLVILSNLHRAKYDFKLFAEEILSPDTGLSDLIKLSEKEWCEKNEMSRRSYYRKRKSAKMLKVP